MRNQDRQRKECWAVPVKLVWQAFLGVGLCLSLTNLTPVLAQSATPSEIIERTRRGFDLRSRGQLLEAQRTFEEVLRVDEKSVSALLGMTEIARTRMDYPLAFKYLDKAARISLEEKNREGAAGPVSEVTDPEILNSYGILFLTLEEPKTAGEYFDRILKLWPNDTRGLLGKAHVAVLERDYSQSESILLRLITKKPVESAIYAALSKLYLEQNKNIQAAQAAQKALENDPYNIEAMSVLCSIRVIERKPEAVRKLAFQVLDLNPYNARIRRLLSQYVKTKKSYPTAPPAAQQFFERGTDFARLREYKSALGEFEQAVASAPQFMQAYLSIGALALQQEDFEKAIWAGEKAIELDPDNALAQLQLSLAHIDRHERSRLLAGANQVTCPLLNAGTAEPAAIGDVFVNYFTLTPPQQKVILASTAPFSFLLPELKKRGAKHYLLQLDRQLPDIPGYELLEDRTTFDGRYYSSIRGVGGLITVSGIEYLDVVEHGGFNTIAHEFAHQVHSSVFDKTLIDRIQGLYSKAVREGRTLDYYAAANEWEYFAQGYEAYVSLTKRAGLGVTGRHTRDELKKLDPALYHLIDEIAASGRKDTSPGNDQAHVK
ncbi:MAG: tetratricopeptide repeat protein [Blastocatellia bacterium]|nr:tetratricopeptide repeat protein [Blastocatellia bacterium]